jgi:hypothetical protein
MATIRVVANFRVKAGREANLLEAARAFKKHMDRLGATFVIVRQVFGPEPNHIVAVSQYSDWNHFAKAQSDREVAQFLEATRRENDPPWESLAVSVSEEIIIIGG